MKVFLLTLLSCLVGLAQSGLPTPPKAADQNANLEQAALGLKDPTQPDIPDPAAIHTAKGKIFQQPAMTGDDIAIMYFQLTGKRVLPSQQASTVEIKILQPGPITNKEVAEIIETKLIMEGYTLAPSPGNARQLRLVPIAGGNTNLKNLGTQVITDKNLLPDNDEIVTYSMRLSYIDPEEAATIFQQVIGQFGPGGTVVPVKNAKSILITDNALLIRSIIGLKDQIDIPGSDLGTKFIELVYADAEEVATQLEELINNEEKTTTTRQRNNRNTNQNNQPPGTSPATATTGSGNGGEVTPLKILADSRTNRLVLSGSSAQLTLAHSLVRELDKPSSAKNSLRRRLRYLPVAEFMPIAADAIEATVGGGSEGGSSSNRANNNQPSSNNRANNDTNTGGSGSSANRATLGGQDGDTAPDSMLIGKTLLVADNISNSIVVNGPPHHIEIVQNLIDELDQNSEQIAIAAVFGRYGNGGESDFGTDIVSLFDNTSGTSDFGGGAQTGSGAPSTVSTIFSSDSLATFAANAIGTGLGFGFAKDDIGVFLNAVKTETNFEQFSRTTVYTTNNRSARISSGSRIAVPTGSNTGTTFGTSTQIEYRDVTLELEVRPLVNGHGEVTLEIAVVNDSLGEVRPISTGDTVLETQDINSEELSTIVTVPDKSLVVLGGLYMDRVSEGKTKVPILGDIPLLGRLFRSDSDEESLDELVIMIYPRIIKSPGELELYQNEYDRSSYITPNARENFLKNSLLDDANGDQGSKAKKTLKHGFSSPEKKNFYKRPGGRK